MSGVRFTAAEDEFLRGNIGRYTYRELARLLTDRFGVYRNTYAVSDRCTKQLKIKRGANTGKFGKGRRDRHEIGAEVESNGYVYVKVADAYHAGNTTPTGYSPPNWIAKQRAVWERANGAEVPTGHIVIFLDNDKTNFSPTNLACISRQTSVVMASNGWFSTDPNITRAAIRYCELVRALTQSETNSGARRTRRTHAKYD